MHMRPRPTAPVATRPGGLHPTPQSEGVIWSVRLLGSVEAIGRGHSITRWPSRAVAALLARLALAPARSHPREELIELLWPGVDLDVGRNRLRQALSTLKGLLEQPGSLGAPVIAADRLVIRTLPGAIECDVTRFEQHARVGDSAAAWPLYRGELMPGFYEDWVLDERRRLNAMLEGLTATPATPAAASAAAPAPSAATAGSQGPVLDLPGYWTRPFGVELPVATLRALVAAQRLVTVHGPGGGGKTRLVVELAQSLGRAPAGSGPATAPPPRLERIVFVPLVHCNSSDDALSAICDALRADGPSAAAERVAASLAGRHTLLVLDNVEQMVQAAGGLITGLLRHSPGLSVLVTSRHLLEVDGEVAFELEGLPLPAPDATLADAATNPALALFVDRARATRADFHLGPRNVAAIIALVRLLGGMPLAIELAASRMRALTPQELLHRLREDAGTPMLDLLARSVSRASADARHASMRHVVAWSWKQLSPAHAAMLRALSVFAAPARLEAVAAVAAEEPHAVLALLDELETASLAMRVDSADGVTRHVLLQPVREFAAERLGTDDARLARQRLRRWLIDFAPQAVPVGPAAVTPELPHVHAAIISAQADDASRQALELAVRLRAFWDTDPLPLPDLQALERALADVDDSTLRADALELLAYGRGSSGFSAEALVHAEAALTMTLDDRRRSLALSRWAWATYLAGQLDAAFDPAMEEASALAQRCGDLFAQATALRMQALIRSNIRLDFSGAEDLAQRAQRLWERLGNRPMATHALISRAAMWAWLGRFDESIAVHLECERAARADSDWVGLMGVTRQLGRVYIKARRWDDAAAAFRRSIQVGWDRHHAYGLAHALLHLPDALVMGTQLETAARLHGHATTHCARMYNRINRIEEREMRRTRRLLRARLGPARAEALRVQGSGLDLAEAVALALHRPAVG